jgi:hypothetical protein
MMYSFGIKAALISQVLVWVVSANLFDVATKQTRIIGGSEVSEHDEEISMLSSLLYFDLQISSTSFATRITFIHISCRIVHFPPNYTGTNHTILLHSSSYTRRFQFLLRGNAHRPRCRTHSRSLHGRELQCGHWSSRSHKQRRRGNCHE